MYGSWSLAGVLFLAFPSAPDPVAAQARGLSPDLDIEARRAFEQGRDAYDHGLFGEALAHFEHAYQLSLRPKLLFNIARAADSDGQHGRAIEAYGLYLERMQDAENREFATARLRKLRELSDARAPSRPRQAAAPGGTVPAASEGAPPRPADAIGRFRTYAGPCLGFGGSVEQETKSFAESQDLELGYGAQLGADYLPVRYLSVGAALRISTLRVKDDNSDRDLLTDILFRPAGRYPFERLGLELYGVLPVGLTIPSLSAAGSTGYGWSEKVGAAVGVTVGAAYFVAPTFALDLELGAMWHWFDAKYQGEGSEVDISFRAVQAMLGVNFVYAPGRAR